MTYDNFIKNIIQDRGQFNAPTEYYEKHHIIPKCKGGTNKKENLIYLTAQEHFIAHKLLAEENPEDEKIVYAYACMAFMSKRPGDTIELTPAEYEEVKIAYSKMLKQKYSDKTKHPSYGTHISEERKQIISKANKGNKYCVGRILSEETRKKISEANKNPSPEKRKKMSEAQRTRNLSGGRNPRAKKVIRLKDKKIYDCIKDAAEDSNYHHETITSKIKRNTGEFMFYKDYLEQNLLKE